MKVNDPTAVLDKCAQLYENIDKKDEAEELYRRRLKMKLHQSDSWLNLGSFFYKNEKLDAARQLLPSALQQLSDSNRNNKFLLTICHSFQYINSFIIFFYF
jgi:Tfp pilus assembly protein PilF